MNPSMRVLVAVLASFGAGLVGFLFVDGAVSQWYDALVKPPLTPPDWVFALVWLLLYALMAGALAIVWNKDPQTERTEVWVRFYFVQLGFNAAWTMFFFGLHAKLIAFFDILCLGFIVTTLVAGSCNIDKRAAYLLAPYLAWILFAAYLNLGIWFLN